MFKGPQGPLGELGAAGPQGPPGPQGPNGMSIQGPPVGSQLDARDCYYSSFFFLNFPFFFPFNFSHLRGVQARRGRKVRQVCQVLR